MAMKRVSDPQISPSGKWVLFSVTDVSLEHNTKTNHLWIVPLAPTEQAGSAKERQLTFGDGESNGRFAPDGKSIALTMKDQIYRMPWNDATGSVGDPTQITNVNGGADGAIWSPDSKRLLFTVSVYPECSDLGDWSKEDACDADKQKAADASPVKAQIWDSLLYRHWDHFTGKRRSHIAVVDADGHNLRDLTPRSAVGDAETPNLLPRRSIRLRVGSRLARDRLRHQPRSRLRQTRRLPAARRVHQQRHLHPQARRAQRESREGLHLPRQRRRPAVLARRQVARVALAGAQRLRIGQVRSRRDGSRNTVTFGIYCPSSIMGR